MAQPQKFLKRLAPLGSLLLLLGLALFLGLGQITPTQASPAPPVPAAEAPAARPPARPLASNISVQLTGVTQSSPTAATVANGDRITYSLTINNSSGETIKDVEIEDLLPPNALINIQGCTPPTCTVVNVTQTVATRGGPVTVVKPEKIRWQFSSLASNQFPLQLSFSGRVICQAEGSILKNQASVFYLHPNNSSGFALSQPLNTNVRVPPPTGRGQFTFSGAPEACSTDGPIGGTSDADWGDFDGDGDLDLALVSWDLGVFVYQNTNGLFDLLWQNGDHRVEGVRWGDFRPGNGFLELVVSGEFQFQGSDLPNEAPGPPFGYSWTGFNYLYEFDGGSDFAEYDIFTSNDGAWRTEVADFSGDGVQDIATITYWGGCSIHLYKNNGAGFFNRSDPTTLNDSYCLFSPPYFDCCLQGKVANSAAWGDVDNDGDPDLAVGYGNTEAAGFPTLIDVFINTPGSNLTNTNRITVENVSGISNFFFVVDLAWGDYDTDGDLDLAAAFSSDPIPPAFSSNVGGLRVYRNEGGSFSQVFSLTTPQPVGAVDWADFDGDGRLELAVGGFSTPPRLYKFDGSAFNLYHSLETASRGDVLAIRAADYDNDGDLDLGFTNFASESWLFTNIAPFLETRTTSLIGIFPTTSVDWGDVNNDGFPDLLYGSGNANKLYNNNRDGTFSSNPPTGFNPNPTTRGGAFGDVDGDGELDLAMGVNGQNLIYLNNSGTFPGFPSWAPDLPDDTYNLLFTDVDQDIAGLPDLLVGNNGEATRLYINPGPLPNTSPVWQSTAQEDTRGLAWAYFDDDILPDIAAATNGGQNRIYTKGDFNNYVLAQSLPLSAPTRSVDWADVDGDGDPDLAVGNFGQANRVYRNDNGKLVLAWTAPLTRNTTSVAWGDWDNDGDPDLAVGNYNQKDQVYANLGVTNNEPELFWLWEAAIAYKTTDLAWADYDGDGDLDLALSQDGGDANGVYENSYALPAHLRDNTALLNIPLPQNPPYLRVARPGVPNQIFQRATLTDPASLVIPINFTIFDPDGTRKIEATDVDGDPVQVLNYEYTLDGGLWYPATVTPTLGVIDASRRGQSYSVQWSAGQDMNSNAPSRAVSDQMQFKITVAHRPQGVDNLPAGPVQRSSSSALSPPFRVRNISCVWVHEPTISVAPTDPITPATSTVQFIGNVSEQVEGQIFYDWDFGEDTGEGQVVQYAFKESNTNVITLTVTQPPCPVTRSAFTTRNIIVGTGIPPLKLYLPILFKSSDEITPTTLTVRPQLTGPPMGLLNLTPGSPAPVADFRGRIEAGATVLEWEPASTGPPAQGYRLYRSPKQRPAFRLLADLPAQATGYRDDSAACGAMYLVIAYNAAGESLPNRASYHSPPCP